jgi:hypothetical protein
VSIRVNPWLNTSFVDVLSALLLFAGFIASRGKVLP